MDDKNEVKEMVDDGSYFSEARKWYSVVYLSIIPERMFHILTMSISVAVLFFAVGSVISLLPIVHTTPILYTSDEVLENLPIISRLSEDDEDRQHPDVILREFFVEQYVSSYERYDAREITNNARIVMQNSSAEVYGRYLRMMDAANPRSPIALYETNYEREVTVKKVAINPVILDPDSILASQEYVAVIDFVSRLRGAGEDKQSVWQSKIKFTYKGLDIAERDNITYDGSDGYKPTLKVDPMKFMVTEYSVDRIG